MRAKDFILSTANELVVKNGDFEIDLSDEQHIQLICELETGNLLEFPLVGVGIRRYKKGPMQPDVISSAIRLQLQQDGYQVTALDVRQDKPIYIDAIRTKQA